MRHDVSYAVRQIRLHPVPAALVVLAFALGIGLNTALFTLVNSILLRSMPGSDNGRVVAIWERTPRAEFSSVSGEAIREWRSQAKSFEAIEAYTLEPVNLTGVDPPEVLSVLEVSASYFQLLRAQPALGRAFRQGEDQPGAPRLAVLSHDFWQRRFGAGRTVLGRTITLDRSPHVIVGVMPAGFRPAGPETAVYLPLVMEEKRAWSFWVIARLNPGVSLAMAQSEMNVVASRMRAAGPAGRRDVSIGVLPIQELWVKDFRAALWLLMGATGLVLLIACANIANLLLARGASRAREFAIRLAVGASRGRLVRQLTIEGLLLALVGGAFGLLLAQWTITAIVRLGVEGLPLFEDPRLDVSVFAFAASVSLLTGIAASAGPAFAATRREHTASRFGRQVRPARLLVVSEFAIAFVLAVSATLLVRSFTRLEGIDLGFDPQRLLTMQLSLPPSPQNDGRPMAALYNRILERIQRTAGVEAAAAATRLPVGGVGITLETRVANRAAEESKDHIATQASIVSTGYFATLRIPIRRGRLFNPHDRRGSTEAVII
ncbi:MAG: ABC transporter permease, partial [Bryobacteraceae bacterium]